MRPHRLIPSLLVKRAARSSLLNGLVSFWKLDENSDGSAPVQRNDSHGTNHLTDNNTCSSAAGVNGNAVAIAASWLTCASNATLQTGDIEFTVAARVYTTDLANWACTVTKGSAADTASIEFGLTLNRDTDRAQFDVWQGGTAQSVQSTNFGSLTVNTWYDVIGWVDKAANTINIEVNGVATSAAKTKTPAAGNAAWSIGAYANGTFPQTGRIDDVAFWKRKLSAAERQAWRDGTYPFDGSGGGIPGTGTTCTLSTTTIGGQAAEYLIPTAALSGVLVIYHHGMGETQTAWRSDALKAGLREALLAEGHLLAASNAHGMNWGNQDSINDTIALYNDAAARFTIHKVIFFSQSMGGMSGLLTAADGTVPLDGWFGIYPCCNLAWCYAHGFAYSIKPAYGIAEDGSDYAAKTAGHDPVLLSGAAFSGLPMRFYASYADTVVAQADNTDAMIARVEEDAAEYGLVQCTGNHGDPSHFQPSDVIAFISRC